MQNANNYQDVSTMEVPMKPLDAIVDGTYPDPNCAPEPKMRFLTSVGQYGPNQGAGTGGNTFTCCSRFQDGNLALSSSSDVAFKGVKHGRQKYDLLTERNTHEMLMAGNPRKLLTYQTAGDPNRRVVLGWRLKDGGEFMRFNAVVVPNSYALFDIL